MNRHDIEWAVAYAALIVLIVLLFVVSVYW